MKLFTTKQIVNLYFLFLSLVVQPLYQNAVMWTTNIAKHFTNKMLT